METTYTHVYGDNGRLLAYRERLTGDIMLPETREELTPPEWDKYNEWRNMEKPPLRIEKGTKVFFNAPSGHVMEGEYIEPVYELVEARLGSYPSNRGMLIGHLLRLKPFYSKTFIVGEDDIVRVDP